MIHRWMLAVGLVFASTQAWAEDPAPKGGPAATPPVSAEGAASPERRSYGVQTLVGDAVSVAMFATGVAINASTDFKPSEYNRVGTCVANCPEDESSVPDALIISGVVGYGLAAPIIHLAHDHPGKAAASLSLRATSTLISLIGVAMCLDQVCDYMIPGALSVGATILLDATTIAKEDVPRPIAPAKMTSWGISPRVDTRTNSAGIVVGGTF